MKLHKNGWGLVMMIVYMSILLAFLLLTVVMVYNLYRYNELIDSNGNNSNNGEKVNPNINDDNQENNYQKYKLYESRIKRNAITFAYTYYLPINESPVKVKLEDMVSKGVMEEIKDPIDNSVCSGYVILSVENEKIMSTPYLKCHNYTTEGYEEE